MDIKKYFDYLTINLNVYILLLLHKTTFENKWGNFKKKEYEYILIEMLDLFSDCKELEKRYLNKRKNQFYAQAKLLLCNNEFIKEIIELAGKWKLIKLAFGNKVEKEKKFRPICSDHQFPERIHHVWKCLLQYLDIRILKKDIETLKKNYNFEPPENYILNLPTNRFSNDIENLLEHFNLSIIWEESIILLLLTGLFFIPQDYCPVMVRKEKGKIKISIPIFQETRWEDIKYKWPEIKTLKDELYGKKRIKSSKDFNHHIFMTLNKEKNKKDWDLINLEEWEIPFDADSEIRAYERLRKGRLRVSKLIKEINKIHQFTPQYIKDFEEITGFDLDKFYL